jgi:hypothetical protein
LTLRHQVLLKLQQHVEVNVEVERAAEALDQRHPAALSASALDARLVSQPAITRCTIPSTGPIASGALANMKRKGRGKLSTDCRTGRGPNTSSTRWRADSAMRRAPQHG